jgi:hypothetical protein
MRVQVGRRATRRRGEQDHADREDRRQLEEHDEAEADRGQHDELADQCDEHGLGMLADPGEIGGGEGEAEPEHDDAQGDGKPDRCQR